MIFIRNCKKYDTSTAEDLFSRAIWDECGTTWEVLYRKRSGEYFLVTSDDWHNRITVFESVDDMKAWAQSTMTPEHYACRFGEVEE